MRLYQVNSTSAPTAISVEKDIWNCFTPHSPNGEDGLDDWVGGGQLYSLVWLTQRGFTNVTCCTQPSRSQHTTTAGPLTDTLASAWSWWSDPERTQHHPTPPHHEPMLWRSTHSNTHHLHNMSRYLPTSITKTTYCSISISVVLFSLLCSLTPTSVQIFGHEYLDRM